MNLEDTGYVEIFESSIHTMYMFQLSPSDADRYWYVDTNTPQSYHIGVTHKYRDPEPISGRKGPEIYQKIIFFRRSSVEVGTQGLLEPAISVECEAEEVQIAL
jgi:hypothetical protein